MGLIKSSVVIFISTILFLTLFLGNLFLTLSWSLEYETVQPHISEYANGMIDDLGIRVILNENYDFMKIYCISYPSFILDQEDFNIEIPCEIINQGPQEVINYGIDNFIYDIYYGEHDCGFWECLKEESTPFVLISEKAKDYWKVLFYWALLASIVLLGLLFVFTDAKNSPLIIIGVLMIAAAFPFRKINWMLNFIPDSSIFDIVLAFFTKSYNVFVIMSIIGAVLFGIGIAFNLFGMGMNVSGFFSKLFDRKKKGESLLGEEDQESLNKEEVKDIVKEEVQKAKSKEKLTKHVKNLVKEELNKSKKN